MNGVQTRFKCKLDVKRCKRFVFPPSSLLPRSNALKTKAIRYFQTDRTLTRIVSPPLHALALQEMGKEVCAIDISPRSVEVMEKRGVRNVRQMNLFDPHFLETFDTILMLMNGSGIIGKLENMAAFFQKMKQLLRPGGCILMDSSDLRYLFEDEDGSFLIDLAGDYYGEIDFRMQYKNIKGDSFDWLYVDFQTLSLYAAGNGFEAELIKEGEHYDYLTRLRWKG